LIAGTRCEQVKFSEAGWSADILVRTVPELNTKVDENVRAPKT
jgi:hypothetical protein